MIYISNAEVTGWEPAICGMRNPMNSWEKSDSGKCSKMLCRDCPINTSYEHWMICPSEYLGTHLKIGESYILGPEDYKLAFKLAQSGSSHSKYRRMIVVYVDILAPLYWWKEFDTYKVGTVANSCSTMHKIAEKEFTLDDFSHEHVIPRTEGVLNETIFILNQCRDLYLQTKDKEWWWQMIQLLPSSYNQKRTVMLNYEVLASLYSDRRTHKLDEWRDFCKWIETLPYPSLITGVYDESVSTYERKGGQV